MEKLIKLSIKQKERSSMKRRLFFGSTLVLVMIFVGIAVSCKMRTDANQSQTEGAKVFWQKEDLKIVDTLLDDKWKVSELLKDRLVTEINSAASLLNLRFVEIAGPDPLAQLKLKELKIIENSRWAIGAKGDLKLVLGQGQSEAAGDPNKSAGNGLSADINYDGTRANYNVRYTFYDSAAGPNEIDSFELEPIDMWRIGVGSGASASIDIGSLIGDLSRLPKPLMRTLAAFLGTISLNGSVRSDSLKDTSPSLYPFKQKVGTRTIYPVTVDIAKKFASTICERVIERRGGLKSEEDACRASPNFVIEDGRSCLCSFKIRLPDEPDFENIAQKYRMMKVETCNTLNNKALVIYAHAPKDFYLKGDKLNVYKFSDSDSRWYLERKSSLFAKKVVQATVTEPNITSSDAQTLCGSNVMTDMSCMELSVDPGSYGSCDALTGYGVSPLKDDMLAHVGQ